MRIPLYYSVVLGLCLPVLVGCRAVPCIDFPVEVTSDPPGVRVEINGDSVGTTPCTATICGLRGRLFRSDSEVRAFAVAPDQRTQLKLYRRRWSIPKTVHLNMYLSPESPVTTTTDAPQPRRYDINVNR